MRAIKTILKVLLIVYGAGVMFAVGTVGMVRTYAEKHGVSLDDEVKDICAFIDEMRS